jgi:hypothetical protein
MPEIDPPREVKRTKNSGDARGRRLYRVGARAGID